MENMDETLLVAPEEIRAFVGLRAPRDRPVPHETKHTENHDGYKLERINYTGSDEDEISALMFRPHSPDGAGVVVFHQHNAEWHLGKSEVAGLVGDHLQAFGPPLAAAGITVLAPDAIGFEDRRRQAQGTQPHPDDVSQHRREFAYRLVTGDSLARKVLDDASTAVSVLAGSGEVDPARIGALGHSFGGHTTLFLTALDERVRFACVSGAAGSFQARMDREVGIGFDQIVPGIATRLDFDTLVRCICPRPLLLVAGDDDRYAPDIRQLAAKAHPIYEDEHAAQELECEVLPGGHALDGDRHDLIIRWVTGASQLANET